MIHFSNESLPDDYKLINSPFSGTTPKPPHHSHVRRLLEEEDAKDAGSLDNLMKVLPTVGVLAEALGREASDGSHQSQAHLAAPFRQTLEPLEPELKQTSPTFMASDQAESVEFPPFFEPHHLVCGSAGDGGAMIMALTRRGLGATVRLGEAGLQKAKLFALQGDDEVSIGPVLGAGWSDRHGGVLQLLTLTRVQDQVGTTGERWRVVLLECPGQGPSEELGGGSWACRQPEGTQPLHLHSKPLAAAVVDEPDTGRGRRLSIALMLEARPGVVLLFSEGSDMGWSPSEEIHLPSTSVLDHGAGATSGLSITHDNALLAITAGGAVQRRWLSAGGSELHPAPKVRSSSVERDFRAACTLPTNGALMRLALRRSTGSIGTRWAPELIKG